MKSPKNKRKAKSVYFRNFITSASIIILSLIILGVAVTGVSYNFVVQESGRTMEKNTEELVHVVSAYNTYWGLDSFDIKMILSTISYSTGFHIMICDTDGQIISCSDRQIGCEHMGQQVPNIIMSSLVMSGSYSGVSNVGGIYGSDMHVVAKSIPNGDTDEISGYIILSSEAPAMSDMWGSLVSIYVVMTAIVLAVTLVVTIITTKRQTKPVKEMAVAVSRFAHGDFSARISENSGTQEIDELADGFNVMADYLERSENTRRDLIANVSHELKTPMTTITGFADGILDGTIPPEKEKEYVKVISSETKRLSRLVKNMLDISQLQAKSSEEVLSKSFNLSEAALSVLVGLEKKITDKKLDVDVQVPEDAMEVLGSEDAITQVIYNLTDNAIKFSAPETTLKLEVWKQNGKAYVAVENTGTVISKDELPYIFDRFHKSDKSRSIDKEGVGLGLYIVKTIINNHNEDIFVTSSDGITKFVFTLTLKN